MVGTFNSMITETSNKAAVTAQVVARVDSRQQETQGLFPAGSQVRLGQTGLEPIGRELADHLSPDNRKEPDAHPEHQAL
jgi:hypothetical protein